MAESFSSFSLGATTQPAEQSGAQAGENSFDPFQLKGRCWSHTLYPPPPRAVPQRRGWSVQAQNAINARSSSTNPDALGRLQLQAKEDPLQPAPQSAYASFPEPVSTDPEKIAAATIAHYLTGAQSGNSKALIALACAGDELSQRFIAATGLEPLLKSLDHSDERIHGPAAATLANLLESTHADNVRTIIGMEGASRLLTLVLSPSQPVVREAARALIAYGLDHLKADALFEQAEPILLEHRSAVAY
jgi:hypothetical protein